MKHKYNIAAFQAGTQGPSALVRLYCGLILIELVLKDAHSPWQAGHNISGMLADIGETALSVQLSGKLVRLKCTARDGTEAPVDPSQYPHIRYIRHESDFPGAVSDADLDATLTLVPDILLSLRRRGLL